MQKDQTDVKKKRAVISSLYNCYKNVTVIQLSMYKF